MCLVPKLNWFRRLFRMKPKIRIAEEDIKVYKLLTMSFGRYWSFFFSSYEWKLNKPQKEPIIFRKTEVYKHWVIDNGLYSYINFYKSSFIINFPSLVETNLYNAIIPKGSHYIIGDFGDIVSDQLIIIDKYK